MPDQLWVTCPVHEGRIRADDRGRIVGCCTYCLREAVLAIEMLEAGYRERDLAEGLHGLLQRAREGAVG